MTEVVVDPDDPGTFTVLGYIEDALVIEQPITVRGAHMPWQCRGPSCILHRPSAHHMRGWPLFWHRAGAIFARLCPHRVIHPDPDGWGSLRHLCDGCCDLNYKIRPGLQLD